MPESLPGKRPDPDDEDTAGRLAPIIGQEAHRVLSERQLQADPKLVAEGWERRFITDSRRTQEVIDLYRELGFEIHLEPVQVEQFDDDCQDCALVAFLKFVTVYTRKK
jgi:hypothetical protein